MFFPPFGYAMGQGGWGGGRGRGGGRNGRGGGRGGGDAGGTGRGRSKNRNPNRGRGNAHIQLGPMHFPPLPSSARGKSGYRSPFFKYDLEEMVQVKVRLAAGAEEARTVGNIGRFVSQGNE